MYIIYIQLEFPNNGKKLLVNTYKILNIYIYCFTLLFFYFFPILSVVAVTDVDINPSTNDLLTSLVICLDSNSIVCKYVLCR